ncbi:hypothetical protein O181_099628 [Austropuccinia psidii MF-1]|uniref:Uncharacterized protein n=1 Tax=Austropuccinia psidii MF-1 TaxID=1389203 RepID=A0A9Q3JBB4_9BASI|nr:hypothetical protein [Austropuccinia psidii MF-1]
MAQESQDSTKSFAAKTQLIGCMTHTLHLSAQDGLEALSKGPSTHENQDIVKMGPMSISTLINPPDGLQLNYNLIISRIVTGTLGQKTRVAWHSAIRELTWKTPKG